MPTLHTQFVGERNDKDGNKVPVEPRIVLLAQGPVVQVTLGIARILPNN